MRSPRFRVVEVTNNHQLYCRVERMGWLGRWRVVDTVNEGGGTSSLRFPSQQAAEQWVQNTFGGTKERIISTKEIVLCD